MAVYGAVFSRLASDMTLVNKRRIWQDGDRATRAVRFSDPGSGFTYIAAKYGDDTVDGRTIDHGIGSRVLIHANELLTKAYRMTLGSEGKPVLDDKGQPTVTLDASGAPLQTSDADAQLDLRRYVGLIDALREINLLVDGPPLQSE